MILRFKLLKASALITSRMADDTGIVRKNLNISVFAFVIELFLKLVHTLYDRKRAQLYR